MDEDKQTEAQFATVDAREVMALYKITELTALTSGLPADTAVRFASWAVDCFRRAGKLTTIEADCVSEYLRIYDAQRANGVGHFRASITAYEGSVSRGAVACSLLPH